MKKLVAALLMLISLSTYSQLYINEILVANASVNYEKEFMDFSSWIEIYNDGSAPVSLIGYHMTDKAATPAKWTIPDTAIPAKGYLIFWADNQDKGVHANFNMDVDGEFIGFYNASLQPVDSFSYDVQHTNISYGRTPDGTSTWKYFGNPTPGKANSTGAVTILRKPDFSVKGGFYSSAQTLNIGHPSSSAKIYYSTDGSEPSDTGMQVSGPIQINKNMVVRARVYDNGFLPSDVVTQTYFINESSALPYISVSVHPSFIWDSTIGIFVGKPLYNYRNEWERAANVEFFLPHDTAQFNVYCGIQNFGLQSRGYPQNPMDVSLKKKYGQDKIKYALFRNRAFTTYHGFVIRNSGYDWKDGGVNDGCGILFRDGIQNLFVQDQMDLDIMSYRPVILFLNGQFWGIADLREKQDKYYCNSLFNSVDKDSLDIIKQSVNAFYELKEGDTLLMQQFFNFIKSNDISDAANYKKVMDSMDVREFMNYMIAETYSCNMDWLSYNIKLWRQKDVIKWRWMLFDLDRGFNGMGVSWNSVNYNRLNDAYKADTDVKNGKWTSIVLGSLMKNLSFKNEFAQTYAAHINTTYQPKRINFMIDSIESLLKPEIQRHIDKWGSLGSTASLSSWNTHVQWTHDFANQRAAYVWGHVKTLTGYSSMAPVKIKRTYGDLGMVYVQGAKLYDSVMSGLYFNNIPIELKAQPRQGYYFIKWEIKKAGKISYVKNAILIDTLKSTGTKDSTFYTAIFRDTPVDNDPIPVSLSKNGKIDDLMFNIFPNPADDRLELELSDYMDGSVSLVDLSGITRYSTDVHSNYIALDVSHLSPGIYLVKVNDGRNVTVKKFLKK